MSKRSFSRRIITLDDLEVTLADAYLRLVHHCTSVASSPTYPAPSMKEAPSITAYIGGPKGDTGDVIAVIAGSHLRWLLSRKHGFSVAEQYLRDMMAAFRSTDRLLAGIWVFSPFCPPDAGLVGKLSARIEYPLDVFGPTHLRAMLTDIEPHIPMTYRDNSNWFIAIWNLLRPFYATDDSLAAWYALNVGQCDKLSD